LGRFSIAAQDQAETALSQFKSLRKRRDSEEELVRTIFIQQLLVS